MFWGCFIYDKKGPCHIWEDETRAEKQEAETWIKAQNKLLELVCKTKWELETGLRRLRVTRNFSGKKPIWRWSKKTGKLVRKGTRGGIDWYRYYKVILEGKLLLFAKSCLKDRPGTIVQEDNASPHAHRHQYRVYKLWNITRLLWPSNSPDLNAIERPWFWIKRETTKHSAITGEKQLKKDWIIYQKKMPQKKIQEWVKAIPIHIQEVI